MRKKLFVALIIMLAALTDAQQAVTRIGGLVNFAKVLSRIGNRTSCVTRVYASEVPVTNAQGDMQEREEIHQSFQLTPGSRVKVSAVSGPVEVETTNSDTAEVHIVRSAETRQELDCYHMVVAHTASSLVIRHEQSCAIIRAHQRVKLLLPRRVDLTLSTISGNVRVGEINGVMRLDSISGAVTLDRATGEAELHSISGPLNIRVARLGARGIRMDSISGRVMLSVEDSLNADLTVNSINGEIKSESPSVFVEKIGPADFRARIGQGGAPISIESITGDITIRRA
ncbi:MAG TPA: DUF4097 family beta strand repeat-containing protein [Pyrinomonadaceae bacterium]|nr:DUF4097 family beta strand repeat-containing protein [Pyrinomonadaceae bacterium]